MSRPTVTTLTCNPTIDLSSTAEGVRPTHKIRTRGERMDPGGGGINVARVLHRFGVEVEALFLAGGVTGQVLDSLLDRTGVRHHRLAIAEDTRLSLTVLEESTGREYRFVPEGPCVAEEEWQAALDQATACANDYLVLSGSLPRCAPDDFYARIAKALTNRGTRLAIDSSGEPMALALEAGGFFLAKPSRGELEALARRPLPTHEDVARAAFEIVRRGAAEHLAVTLGAEGALLVDARRALFLPAIPVETQSAVGAGDSFLAGMIAGLVEGLGVPEAFRLAIAAGAATAQTPGTDLCHPAAVRSLLTRAAKMDELTLIAD